MSRTPPSPSTSCSHLRQLSRIDLIVDAEGTPWFLEANVLPGMTETSLVPQAIEAAGLTLPGLYSALAIEAAALTFHVKRHHG